MPRYKYLKILKNDSDFYRFLRRNKEGKSVTHYATPVLNNPDLVSRINSKTTNHIWSYGDRLYKLAHQFYGEPEYWWVIAWWNGLPTEADISNGDVLEIPLNLEEALIALRSY